MRIYSMIYIVENIVPILAATVAAFGFGGLWFGVLSRFWSRAQLRVTGRPDTGRRGISTYTLVFIAEFWMCAILAGALILAPPEASPWAMVIGSAIIIWVGFVLPAIVADHHLAGRPFALTLLQAGHWGGAMVVMAVVLQATGVSGPSV